MHRCFRTFCQYSWNYSILEALRKKNHEENTVRPETIQIPDEISSQSNLNDYQPMVKYYKISETREIQGSPPPYTLSIQKPAAAKLKPNLWSLHVLPIHNTLVLIIDLDERRKQSKNKGFQAIGT
ncbi:uncharacterized protein LAJ45_03750 [Morchella importuna]|uniref:uncharacterized protein n=1 Tax=Morchella importuna TaxID=1174673 RepID=UPI001E8CC2E2|nr:uncharacterized protein LAJ45_03750 [Morchella importuna]KAH8152323.1 hypothetical protein LAJ45_03750 [Morchella importuna]